ncbi:MULTISPECIES: Mbeg1-like protein [unclassified Enterococcus]|uniref:Mbeg1-like protein n=1 Tax=unclassified Enterococcus TaxID=2608891 RepID=UPI001552F1A0|nr:MULTISPECIES: Mbeg1-like protein [unclassified Enterococcus]MBS7576243.1 DUF2974 domain-containing protein [Enterococcus sp. MMGLQ5-2]MBS7583476.1 DUF2974 domain-containing protein [Enterococcus sp. MMGLQ5-1]NPD11336.1 DUF2974 domain-containing protein [Enterococcus sp. MMGLQ5-1]NPD36079.1 DUF2974 domain-containing protein [Enterococcus sp. MMGLQ5-2]
MNNMLDYINQYGDLSFAKNSFNEIDALILAQSAYFDFSSFAYKSTYQLKDIVGSEMITKMTEKTFNAHSNAKLLSAMIKSQRYRNITFRDFIDDKDLNQELQFSAITYQLTSAFSYIAIRGTDISFLGWKEDFNMAFLPQIPSQIAALAYVQQFCLQHKGQFAIGGHSKGGNLAVFAGIELSAKSRQRLTKIYNFDGPGFRSHELSYKSQLLRRLIYKVVPQGSIIGILFDLSELNIIRSYASGYWQHDPFSWSVNKMHFEGVAQLELPSKYLRETIPAWLEKVDNETKERVVSGLYQLLIDTGYQSVLEIEPFRLQNLKYMADELKKLPPETQSATLLLIKKLFESSLEQSRKRLKK